MASSFRTFVRSQPWWSSPSFSIPAGASKSKWKPLFRKPPPNSPRSVTTDHRPLTTDHCFSRKDRVMPKLSIRDIELANKHVFIRVDFNVPLTEDDADEDVLVGQ